MAVGQALEVHLHIPPHQLRVTLHHPEHFFIIFDLPVHRSDLVRLGSLNVDVF